MADRFPLILNTSAGQIQEIASGDVLDLTGNNIANAGIISATSFKLSNGDDITASSSTQLTIGVRVGAAVTFPTTGSSFNVVGRSGNISISI